MKDLIIKFLKLIIGLLFRQTLSVGEKQKLQKELDDIQEKLDGIIEAQKQLEVKFKNKKIDFGQCMHQLNILNSERMQLVKRKAVLDKRLKKSLSVTYRG